MMRIGLYGGTFNPIHRCHLTIARQTKDRLGLDQVLFIPSGDPPHKPAHSLLPAHHRYAMVKLALEHEEGFALSDVELVRETKSYTIDTVRTLQARCSSPTEFFFLIGLDSFLELPTWKHPEDLLTLCHFVVLSRPPLCFAELKTFPLVPSIDPGSLNALDTETLDRLDCPGLASTSFILLRLPPCHISATDIRQRAGAGQALKELLPEGVESYIIHHDLFREDSDRTRLQG